MLVSTIINSALRKLGVVASGEIIEPEEQNDALTALQVMLRSWSAEKINVFSSVSESYTLTSGTNSYTWGVGGVINTPRPNAVVGASILDSNGTTYPVEIISESKYRKIPTKTSSGRPYYIFPKYTYPYVITYLYPTPNTAETLNLESLKPFTESSSFDSADDTLVMPVIYEEPIIYNLAVRCAPEYGKSVPSSVARVADVSYNSLITRNSANHVEPIGVLLPINKNNYNININL